MGKGLGVTQEAIVLSLLNCRPNHLSTSELAIAIFGEVSPNIRHNITRAASKIPKKFGIHKSTLPKPCDGGKGHVNGWERCYVWRPASTDKEAIVALLSRRKKHL